MPTWTARSIHSLLSARRPNWVAWLLTSVMAPRLDRTAPVLTPLEGEKAPVAQHRAEHAVDERRGVVCGQATDQSDGLGHGHRVGNLVAVQQLERADAQGVPVDRRHPAQAPPLGVLSEQLVDALPVLGDAADEGDGVGVARALTLRRRRLQRRHGVLTPHLRGVEDVESALAGPGARRHQAFTRPRYDESRVSTLTRSPWVMNNGTWIWWPVSRVAGLVRPVALSPTTPGSV